MTAAFTSEGRCHQIANRYLPEEYSVPMRKHRRGTLKTEQRLVKPSQVLRPTFSGSCAEDNP